MQYSTQFGYSRKDVLLIGGGLIAFGYIMYYGLQAAGLDAGAAGNWVQLVIFIGICFGWVGSYLWRVATKVGSRGGGGIVLHSPPSRDPAELGVGATSHTPLYGHPGRRPAASASASLPS